MINSAPVAAQKMVVYKAFTVPMTLLLGA